MGRVDDAEISWRRDGYVDIALIQVARHENYGRDIEWRQTPRFFSALEIALLERLDKWRLTD